MCLEEKFKSDYEIVSLEELFGAYCDCRKRKSNKPSFIAFSMNEQVNLVNLWKEINNGTYEIGFSNTFIVTRPKHREVFAADFRDRIVHHLLIKRTLHLFENHFITDTYNCRKEKGTLYGVTRLDDAIKEISNNYNSDAWILKCDIHSFFMSIDKTLLWEELEKFLTLHYTGPDLDWVLYITKKISMHHPEEKCIKKGDLTLWDYIPKDKSLFTNGVNKGMAIGNLTSQIFVNFFLSNFDHWISKIPNIRYGRYVDDFYIISRDKEILINLINKIRIYLKENNNLELHPDKWYLQHHSKGIAFIGSYLKFDKKYIGKNLQRSIYNFSRDKYDGNIEKYISRYNSYTGFLRHHASYKIRKRLYNDTPDEVRKLTYIDSNFLTLKLRSKYKKKNLLYKKIKEEYVNGYIINP